MILNFKEFFSGDMAPIGYLSGDQTGSDVEVKDQSGFETGTRMGSTDVMVRPIEKNGVVNYLNYTKNPIQIGMTDGTKLNIPYDQLRVLLGRNPLRKLKYGSNITVRFQSNSPNAKVEYLDVK